MSEFTPKEIFLTKLSDVIGDFEHLTGVAVQTIHIERIDNRDAGGGGIGEDSFITQIKLELK